ncbi:DUF6100 family protein [Oscillospiraceae bacterium MB08-C2-2]|nr:DUF6100 family protein [Oscillospiraceae bacterium MB08-C2-2]
MGLAPAYLPLPDVSGVELAKTNGTLVIKMDGLLPFPAKGNVYYLHEKLNHALGQWQVQKGLCAPLFTERCAVVFLYHYSSGQWNSRQVRDYDNLEYRCVLNTLARRLLWDDDPRSYVCFHGVVPDTSTYTEIRVMALSAFQNYISNEY